MNVRKQYDIAYKGLAKGVHHFGFEVDNALFEEFERGEIKSGKAVAEVELERGASVLTLYVTIKGTVTVECDRCLDDMELPIDYKGTLEVKFSTETDDYDGDVMWINPAEDYIRLAGYIYESILLSLPYSRIHENDENGKPLCNPDMLARFRTMSPEEFNRMTGESEEGLASNPELGKLKALLAEEKN